MTLIQMQDRLQKLELAQGQTNIALGNLASKRQLNHILTLFTNQITELQDRISNLESQIEVLKRQSYK